MVEDLCRLTAEALSARLRDGEITAEQLARACLVRIAAREADVRAWSYVDPDAVIRQARELDKLPSRGPLHGIPIGVKDIYNTADSDNNDEEGNHGPHGGDLLINEH